MINRIGDNSNLANLNVRQEQPVRHEKEFSIDYKDEKNDTGSKGFNGVKVELSANKENPDEVVVEYSLFSEIKDRLSELRDMLKNFWDKVWNGSADKDTAPVIDEESVQKPVSEMNLEEVERYLSDNGKKRLAKSSDILTTYNQFGKIVEIDPSEKNKIFHGNKSWKEL